MQILVSTLNFKLTSWGGGASYLLENLGNSQEVFVQGDDAIAFLTQWEAIQERAPDLSTDRVMRRLWDSRT